MAHRFAAAAVIVAAVSLVAAGGRAVSAAELLLLPMDFYVSAQSGSDSNPGTSATQAFQTLQRAQAAVRTVVSAYHHHHHNHASSRNKNNKNAGDDSDFVVHIAAGRYYLPQGMRFNASDGFPEPSTRRVVYQVGRHKAPDKTHTTDGACCSLLLRSTCSSCGPRTLAPSFGAGRPAVYACVGAGVVVLFCAWCNSAHNNRARRE